MPFFAYKARDPQGQLVQGVLEAADTGAVVSSLLGSGATPLDIQLSAAPRRSTKALFEHFAATKIGNEDVLLFSRQMYTLLKAGVPIMGALRGLQESTTNPAFAKVIGELRESLDAGRELSMSLSRHPRVFSAFFTSMVRVGEATGRLEEVFLRLFHHLEFEQFMRDQVKSAIRYPAFVVLTMALAVVIINIFVIPAFAKVFAGFKAELPLMTRVLIEFSSFTVNWWPVLLLGVVGAVFGFRAWTGTARGRMAWDTHKLKIPIAGKIILKATLARFSRSFSLALRSGLPAVQALSTVANTVDSTYVGRRLEQMREGVERGESILRTARAAGVFTPIVLQMVAVGEESGALDDLMSEVADMYQREVEYELKTLASQIEPILIMSLGVLVLILALGVFLPLWDLGSAAMGKR